MANKGVDEQMEYDGVLEKPLDSAISKSDTFGNSADFLVHSWEDFEDPYRMYVSAKRSTDRSAGHSRPVPKPKVWTYQIGTDSHRTFVKQVYVERSPDSAMTEFSPSSEGKRRGLKRDALGNIIFAEDDWSCTYKGAHMNGDVKQSKCS